MRAGPPFLSSFVVLSAGWALGLGCFLDASPYADTSGTGTTTANGGSGAGTTSVTTTSSTTATTTDTGGSGGTTTTSPTTTSDTTGGGGTGGTTTTSDTTGGGGTGGQGGSGGTTTSSTTSDTTPTTPLSCTDALNKGVLVTSGVTMIDPDGAAGEPPLEVYCDQEYDGGGWALVHNSVAAMAGGNTTAFWNIPYAMRLMSKVEPDGAPPGLDKNCYAGGLYRYGKDYRDDVVDDLGVEVKGVLRAKATGINETTMKLLNPEKEMNNLSEDVWASNFNTGWSAPDADHDGDNQKNCATTFQNVTQHYKSCFAYSLGASTYTHADPAMNFFDGGWGPHMLNGAIKQVNMNLPMGAMQLTTDGGFDGQTSRMDRITRFTRW